MLWVRWREKENRRFKPSVAIRSHPEHGPAEHDRSAGQRRVLDVLDHPRLAAGDQELPRRADEVWVCRVAAHLRDAAVPLTRRAGVDGVELVPVGCEVFERVGLNEREGEPGLRAVVHARHIEAGPVVADCTAARPAKEVQKAGALVRYRVWVANIMFAALTR